MKKGELLSKMILLATNAHHEQFDKGGTPYILHCMKVMHYLKTDDEELQCIALGHDIIEDTSVSYKDLVDQGFTERIINGIRCMTKQRGQTYEEYKLQVLSNVDSMRVKLSDLRHNSDIRRIKNKDISQKDIERIAKYQKFYLEIQSKLMAMEE